MSLFTNSKTFLSSNRLQWLALVVVLALALMTSPQNTCDGKKIDRNSPHSHNGLLTPYTPGPFGISLESKDESSLGDGKPVMKQIKAEDGEGGRVICVQDVTAPKEAVWNQILDLNSYVGKVDRLKTCKNYYVKKNPDGTTTIKTKFITGVLPGYSYEFYCDHTYAPEKDSLIWSLDYEKTSDFNDVAGHWHLENHPNKDGCTRVFYGCDVKLPSGIPKPIVNYITKQALKQATSWVKRESELKPEAKMPSEYAPAWGQ